MTIYKGFWIRVYPVIEPTEKRVARGDWQSKILGYRYTIRRAKRATGLSCEAEGFATEEMALQDAENRIDAQIDSL